MLKRKIVFSYKMCAARVNYTHIIAQTAKNVNIGNLNKEHPYTDYGNLKS